MRLPCADVADRPDPLEESAYPIHHGEVLAVLPARINVTVELPLVDVSSYIEAFGGSAHSELSLSFDPSGGDCRIESFQLVRTPLKALDPDIEYCHQAAWIAAKIVGEVLRSSAKNTEERAKAVENIRASVFHWETVKSPGNPPGSRGALLLAQMREFFAGDVAGMTPEAQLGEVADLIVRHGVDLKSGWA